MSYVTFSYVVEEIALLWGTLAFLRFFLQRGGMLKNEPWAMLSVKLTQWLVKPSRRLVKPIRGWDAAIVFAVFVVCVAVRYFILLVGVALNPSWFKPSMIILEMSRAALLLSKCAAYAVVFIMVFKWMTRDPRFRGSPGVESFHQIYRVLMRPFAGGSPTTTAIMRAGVFVLLLLWVLVMADSLRYFLNVG